MKWQRKLGSPKPEETFHDLFTRARMLEECEKQFAASANVRSSENQKKPFNDRVRKPPNSKPKETPAARVQEKPVDLDHENTGVFSVRKLDICIESVH